ncbi:hypothetical protein KCV87_12160 [Actinosynnema pretiosum subsp. pretiosum]|uniref:Uncharacterized protein n=1 Tax=Actinosynnema pretiosum subsp. pretiosum TaxID=103721 RepID=A0AA45LBH7_9PSEU|nr:hypothetical protein KCV87_12160 [Actinosynnema pretiosum subsp. pretiosum]
MLEALRNVVVTMVRSGPHATFPDTTAGWAGVSAALVQHLSLGRGDVVRARELVPAAALRRPPGESGAFDLAPDTIVDRRRIVFAGGQVIPVRGSGDTRLHGARVADHAFPWTVLAVEESFIVIRDEDQGVLRVLVNVREPAGALVLLHDALWLLLGREAQLEVDSQMPPPHLQPVLETLAEGATDAAAQRALVRQRQVVIQVMSQSALLRLELTRPPSDRPSDHVLNTMNDRFRKPVEQASHLVDSQRKPCRPRESGPPFFAASRVTTR